MYTPKIELNGIQFITDIKTPTCCSTGVPTSGNKRTKEYKPDLMGLYSLFLRYTKYQLYPYNALTNCIFN